MTSCIPCEDVVVEPVEVAVGGCLVTGVPLRRWRSSSPPWPVGTDEDGLEGAEDADGEGGVAGNEGDVEADAPVLPVNGDPVNGDRVEVESPSDGEVEDSSDEDSDDGYSKSKFLDSKFFDGDSSDGYSKSNLFDSESLREDFDDEYSGFLGFTVVVVVVVVLGVAFSGVSRPMRSEMRASSMRLTSTLLPNHPAKADADAVVVVVVVVVVGVAGEVVVGGDEDTNDERDPDPEDLDALVEGALLASLRSRLRDFGFTSSSMLTSIDCGSRAANRFASWMLSPGSSKGLERAAFRFGTTLNMFPPWKSSWRGEKFGVSSELAPGRGGYHELH